MSLKKQILVKNISNLSDARYCAGMGVQILGFEMDAESPDYIPKADIKEIKEWVEGIELGIQLGKYDAEDWKSIESEIQPDFFIVSEELLHQIDRIYSSLLIELEDIPERSKLIEFEKDDRIKGLVLKLDGQEINNLNSGFFGNLNRMSAFPVFIETNSLEEKIEFLADLNENIGFVMHGGKEIKPGYKDFSELAPVLEFLEVDQ